MWHNNNCKKLLDDKENQLTPAVFKKKLNISTLLSKSTENTESQDIVT